MYTCVSIHVKMTQSFLSLFIRLTQSFYLKWQVSECSVHRALRVWIIPCWGVPQAYLCVSAVIQTHKCGWGRGGYYSFTAVVCGLRILWIFLINHFLLFLFLQILYIKRIKKYILFIFIKLIYANTITKDLTPLWPLWWGHVFGQGDTPSTHIYTYTGYTCFMGY